MLMGSLPSPWHGDQIFAKMLQFESWITWSWEKSIVWVFRESLLASAIKLTPYGAVPKAVPSLKTRHHRLDKDLGVELWEREKLLWIASWWKELIAKWWKEDQLLPWHWPVALLWQAFKGEIQWDWLCSSVGRGLWVLFVGNWLIYNRFFLYLDGFSEVWYHSMRIGLFLIQ